MKTQDTTDKVARSPRQLRVFAGIAADRAELAKLKVEHAALVAVAEAAQEFISVCGSLPFMKYSGSHYEQWAAAKQSLANLAAVRAGNEVAK